MGGGLLVLLGLWLMQRVCSLSARVLHESLLVPVLTYSNGAMIWKEKERSMVWVVQRFAEYQEKG